MIDFTNPNGLGSPATEGLMSTISSANRSPALPASRARQTCLSLVVMTNVLLVMTSGSGCTALHPVRGVPASYLPDQFIGPSRDNKRTIDLSLLVRSQPDQYRVASGDVLSIFVPRVLGVETTEVNSVGISPPINMPTSIEDPPTVGYPIQVRDDDTISLPQIPPLPVGGMTLFEVEQAIFKAYTETHKILNPQEALVMVSLQRPRITRVLVVRQEATTNLTPMTGAGALNVGTTGKGTARTVTLKAYENDVLHALARAEGVDGLPGLNAENVIYIIRRRARHGQASTPQMIPVTPQYPPQLPAQQYLPPGDPNYCPAPETPLMPGLPQPGYQQPGYQQPSHLQPQYQPHTSAFDQYRSATQIQQVSGNIDPRQSFIQTAGYEYAAEPHAENGVAGQFRRDSAIMPVQHTMGSQGMTGPQNPPPYFPSQGAPGIQGNYRDARTQHAYAQGQMNPLSTGYRTPDAYGQHVQPTQYQQVLSTPDAGPMPAANPLPTPATGHSLGIVPPPAPTQAVPQISPQAPSQVPPHAQYSAPASITPIPAPVMEGSNVEASWTHMLNGFDPTIDNPNVIRIPVRLGPGENPHITEEQITLYDGDIIFIESRETEVFYTAGLLGGGQYTLPRDYDLGVLEAVSIAESRGNAGNNVIRSAGGVSALNQDISTSASRLAIIRTLPNGKRITIEVDLRKAMRYREENIRIQPGDVLVLQYTFPEAIGAFTQRYLLEGAVFGIAAGILTQGR